MRISVEPSTDPDDYDFSHEIRVRFVETDGMNVVHHSNYLVYLEEARVAYLTDLGHPYTEWREAGIESPVLESFVRYRRALQFGDAMTVHVRLAAVSRATFQMTYLITVDGEDGGRTVRATGATAHGCTTAGGRPTRLPGWLTELARDVR